MRDSGGAARHRGAKLTSGDALYGALDPIAVRATIAAQSHRWLPASTQRLDEIGYLPFGREQANLYFQVVAKRYDLALEASPSPQPGRLGWRPSIGPLGAKHAAGTSAMTCPELASHQRRLRPSVARPSCRGDCNVFWLCLAAFSPPRSSGGD